MQYQKSIIESRLDFKKDQCLTEGKLLDQPESKIANTAPVQENRVTIIVNDPQSIKEE